jgi:hypothetical protein
MRSIRLFFEKEYNLVYLFCLAVMLGPAVCILFGNDLSQFTDSYDYMSIANLNFDRSPIRRYRVLIPLVAGALNFAFGNIFDKLAPRYYQGDFSLPFCFFLININLMALAGTLVYRYCKAYGAGIMAALLGLLVMLTCRYTPYYAGLPMVDSLYFFVIALALAGIKEKNSAYIVAAIFLGPFAKEAFLFFAPVIFFYSHIPKIRMALYFLASGILVFSFRYLYDRLTGFSPDSGLAADLSHVPNIWNYFRVLFSFSGLYKIVSNLGVWLLIPLLAIWRVQGYGSLMKERLDRYMLPFMLLTLLQMLLSGTSMERMFYMSLPVVCVFIAISAELAGKTLRIAPNR